MPTSNARIGYVNLLESGTVVASSEDAGFPVANSYDWLTSDFFKPSGGGTINITLTLGSPASADYFAFYNQNLYSLSGTIKLQYWNGSTYEDCFSAVTPTDNKPVFVSFDSQTSTQWRVVIVCASVFSIACISFGPQMALEYGMYMDWTPPALGRSTSLLNSLSDGGAFLGRSIIANGVKTSIDVKASDAWMRSTWLPFVKVAEKRGFFFIPDLVGQPTEAVFAWTEGDIPAPRHVNYGYMSVSVPIRGLVE